MTSTDVICKMSLVNLIDTLYDPQNPWIESYNAKNFLVNPRVDLYPVEGGLELAADLPGLTKEDIIVEVKGSSLTLTGQRVRQVEDDGKYHYAERFFGKFTRKIRLPFEVDPTTVKARFENGVLHVFLPQNQVNSGLITIE